MNTFQNLIDNGIDPHTAQSMLDDYSKKIGTMTGKQAVDILLSTERDITGRIHSAIVEILRKGYENGGKEQIKSMVEFIRYKMDVMEEYIDRRG